MNGKSRKKISRATREKIRENSQRVLTSLKVKSDRKRTPSERTADWLTTKFGSVWFFNLNLIWFIAWMAINLGLIRQIKIFDPFPFGLLTMMVSLEAIFLSVTVLISQNRSSKVNALREEADLQIDIITEEEITKILQLLAKLLEKNGIDVSQDKELQSMMRPTQFHKIEKNLAKQVS